jgi:hypothetical protein
MTRFARALVALSVFASFVPVAACSSSNGASSSGHVCTAGNYVYCRCEDRSEGTKLCQDDGASFAACVCDGSQPPDPTDPGKDGTPPPLDPVPPPPPPDPSKPQIDAACTGKLGVVAGMDDDLDAYVASYKGGGVFDVAKSHGPALRGPATLLAAGGALVATYLSRFELVSWAKMAGGTWSAPASVGSATTTAPPSTTLFNGALTLLYLGTDGHLHQGKYGTAGWDDATLSAEMSTATTGAPDMSAPAAAGVGSSLVVVVAGSDGTLARETYSAASWGPWIKVPEKAYGTAPTLIALEPGAAKDLLLVWTETDNLLHAAVRDATSHAWSADMLIDSAAAATDVAAASLANGNAIVVYRASNGQAYTTTYDAAKGFSPPQELVAGANPPLAGVPSITRGRCGSDATVAYAQASDGAVKIVRLVSGAWTGPFDVPGIPKAAWVGVGELP